MNKYSMIIRWSNDDNGYIAIVPELPGVSAFGESTNEALREVTEAMELYLENLASQGISLPKPFTMNEYSGQFRLRIPKSLHKELAIKADLDGVSLNTYVINTLSKKNALASQVFSIPHFHFESDVNLNINLSSKDSELDTSKSDEGPLRFDNDINCEVINFKKAVGGRQ